MENITLQDVKNLYLLFVQKILNYNFLGKYEFNNRQKKNEFLLIVVAGYKKFLWDCVFKRIKKYSPDNVDICIVVPGKNDLLLKQICKDNDWSYLYTKDNKLSLAQNIAIKEHPKAQFVYKIDEDIFLTKNFFAGLKEVYDHVIGINKYKVGFIAPIIPINGYGYIRFLEKFKFLPEYEKRFGTAYYSCTKIPAQNNGEAAIWLWKKSFPLEDKAEKLRKMEKKFSICHHQFSIGAIFFTRKFWEEIGGFRVGLAGELGREERVLCNFCMENSYAIIIAENVFVGHFCFGPQFDVMYDFYIKNKEKFEILE